MCQGLDCAICFVDLNKKNSSKAGLCLEKFYAILSLQSARQLLPPRLRSPNLEALFLWRVWRVMYC